MGIHHDPVSAIYDDICHQKVTSVTRRHTILRATWRRHEGIDRRERRNVDRRAVLLLLLLRAGGRGRQARGRGLLLLQMLLLQADGICPLRLLRMNMFLLVRSLWKMN